MGRITEYFCDECKKKFGNLSHLNIKQASLFRSIIVGTNWKSVRVSPTRCQGEYHFCDSACLKKWIDNLELPKFEAVIDNEL